MTPSGLVSAGVKPRLKSVRLLKLIGCKFMSQRQLNNVLYHLEVLILFIRDNRICPNKVPNK